MGKSIIDFDEKSVKGKAQLTDKQVESFKYGNSQRLRKDLVYVVPKQWIHSEEMEVNGVKRLSPKVFCVGYDADGTAQVVTSISVNTLRARHLGKVADGILEIQLKKDDKGLLRAAERQQQYPVMVSGNLPLKVDGKEAYTTRDFAFKVNDRYPVFNFKFAETSKGSGKWNVLAKEGTSIADLDTPTVNEYEETGIVSDDTSLIPNFSDYAVNE